MQAIYTAEATVKGNRDGGHVETSDKKLALDLNLPKELDGKGGPGVNPEQLFAAGYAACFGSAIKAVAGKSKVETGAITVTAKVGIGKDDSGEGFGLTIALEANLAGLSKDEAQKIVDDAHKLCPYSRATRNNVPVTVTAV